MTHTTMAPTARGGRHSRVRLVAAAMGAVAVGGLVAASAATLGGIDSGGLGADFAVVASCDSDGITSSWSPSYSSGTPGYSVGGVALSGIASGCSGNNLKVELTGAGNTGLGEAVTTVTGTSQTVTFPTAVDAELVTGVAVTIYD